MLATNVVGGFGNRQRRVGGAHLGAVSDSVNAFLQFYFKKAQEPQKSAVFGSQLVLQCGAALTTFKTMLTFEARRNPQVMTGSEILTAEILHLLPLSARICSLRPLLTNQSRSR